MNALIAWWARNTVAANLLMMGILIAGIMSFISMEREVWPTFRVNWVEITVSWPGAAPQEVEEQIILHIEESLADLDNVDRVRSTAYEGLATLYIEADRSINMDRFINDVKLRVDGIASLPRDIEPPRVRELLTRNELIRIGVSGDVDERILTRTAEKVRDEVALLPGVSIVTLFGQRSEEVSIELSENALRRYGLSFDEVTSAIRASSINLSAGSVRTSTGDVQLRARNLADDQTDFNKIIIRQTPDGGTIRLGDVARVIDGFEDVNLQASLNGERAILVQVMTAEEMNVVVTSQSVRKYLETAQERMPEGVSLILYADESKAYYDRMETISKSAFYGLLLVFAVLILSLRPKVALWVTMGIATAYAGAFIFLPANDVSLNFLSLFAFLLVIGVVVDDAIVVGENIHEETERTGGGVDAAILGTQLVAKPVIYAVATTMIVFAPWLFLSGLEVEFTRHISIIVIAALSFSLIEALFILPAHLSHLKAQKTEGRFGRFQKKIAQSITRFAQGTYRRWLFAAVRRRGVTASIFLALFILAIGVSSTSWLKFSFNPDVESEQISVDVTLPEGTPFNRALEILGQLQKAEKALEAEANERMDGAGKLIENWYTRARQNSVLALVRLAPAEQRDLSAKEAADRLRELIGEIPDAENLEINYTLNQNQPEIELAINHPDMDVLRAAVADLKAHLSTYDTVFNIRDSLQTAMEELRFSLKPGARELGFSLAEVARQVRQAYYGEEVQRLPREGSDVRVFVRYPKDERQSLESLSDFRLRNAEGLEVPLLSVADLHYQPGIKRIDRRERQRSAVISAELSSDMREQIYGELRKDFYPAWEKRYPGVSRGEIGSAEGQAKFMAEILSLEGIALFAMYALIAVAFRSYFLPLLVMTAIPFGFVGAVLGHLLFDMPITLFSYFGLAAAAGVVVNDNLVLVDYIGRLREKGMGAMDALVEAGVARFRPILLTSITTFVGLIPMMAERSTQAQFLKPTVVALSFGVLVATFVTLFLVPALYGLGEDMKRFMKGLWTGRKQAPLGSQSQSEPSAAE
ncbi:acriflavin resistance protein [Iodidimonas nitroreducens]|uniref:Acriflavin resistance protein n=1 Tax=Iodidimonas nitroreducens TaxID=1236968 RepID=A0A5A7N4U3_9PROT|nr:efflux RND transporter permease subunit [Iodidimonas nitroreducens]GAK32458.1 multidrug resistance protein MdtB [alpha proteobacterium Q-1]GER02774.1 acriflavin resistance protein [Iodidimonas nitroreducens]